MRAVGIVARAGGAAGDESMHHAPILVVDDDPLIREMVAVILEVEGYPVTSAANGAEALRTIEGARPSLVLLDLEMPVLDGRGFARALRGRGVTVPIVVMTAAEGPRRWAEAIGAADWLAKPFDLYELLAAVERLRACPEGVAPTAAPQAVTQPLRPPLRQGLDTAGRGPARRAPWRRAAGDAAPREGAASQRL